MTFECNDEGDLECVSQCINYHSNKSGLRRKSTGSWAHGLWTYICYQFLWVIIICWHANTCAFKFKQKDLSQIIYRKPKTGDICLSLNDRQQLPSVSLCIMRFSQCTSFIRPRDHFAGLSMYFCISMHKHIVKGKYRVQLGLNKTQTFKRI